MLVRILLSASALFVCLPLAAANDPTLLDQAVKRHSASLAAINSLSAKVSLESELVEDSIVPAAARPKDGGRRLPPHRGEYARSGQRVRVIEVDSPLGQRTILRDYGAQTGQMRPQAGMSGGVKGAAKPSAVAGPAWTVFSHLDISEGYLFALPPPIHPDYGAGVSLAQVVAKARNATANRELLNGVDTVRLDISSDGEGNGFQIWLDVNTNYLFRRIVNIGPKGPRLEIQILEYTEPKLGVFCPSRAEKIIPKVTKSILTISDIRVNEPIPESVFSTKLPSGTQVVNHAEGKVYEVNQSGRPEKVVGRIIEPPPTNASEPEAGTAPTPLLADEPKAFSWSRIVLAASVAFAVAGGVIWYRRRKIVT